MEFTPIDTEKWARREQYLHFTKQVPCTYSITRDVDVTGMMARVKQDGIKIYPRVMHALMQLVNAHAEFRTDEVDGTLGVYSEMSPTYTIFHPETETFSAIWTDYDGDLNRFAQAYAEDIARYGKNTAYMPKPDAPENLINISMIPWTDFTGFTLHLDHGSAYFLPIFTIGRIAQREGRMKIPLCIQAHHAVCDGFHVSRFFNELEDMLKI